MDQELLKEGASVMESAEAHCLSSFPHKQQTARFSSPHTQESGKVAENFGNTISELGPLSRMAMKYAVLLYQVWKLQEKKKKKLKGLGKAISEHGPSKEWYSNINEGNLQ